MEFCVAASRTRLCRENYIVPCGNTQHPPAGGSGCLCVETSLDIMLFPTAWVFPVDDTGNATYWSVVVSVPLSFFSFPLPCRDIGGKRRWKRCPVPALEGGQQVSMLWADGPSENWGRLSLCWGATASGAPCKRTGVGDWPASIWGRGRGIGFGCCVTFFCYPWLFLWKLSLSAISGWEHKNHLLELALHPWAVPVWAIGSITLVFQSW